jgi:site-specific DNA recombinase
VRLPAGVLEQVRTDLQEEIARQRAAAGPEMAAARRRLSQLEAERHRLARAVVVGTVPDDLALGEYQRIDREREEAERIVQTAETVSRHIEATLDQALELLGRCDEVYRQGAPRTRRLANQFFFNKLLIGRGARQVAEATAEIEEPWATLPTLVQEVPASMRPGSRELVLVAVPGLEPGTYRV